LNNTKRSLHSVLEELAADFAVAAIAAAREALFEFGLATQPVEIDLPEEPNVFVRFAAAPRPRATEQRTPARERKVGRPIMEAARQGSPIREAARKGSRIKRERSAPDAASSGSNELLITDPMALLAALETADGPAAPTEAKREPSATPRARAPKKEPQILKPAAAEAPVVPIAPTFLSPALREGEVIVRRSAGGVVLRRRRG